MDKEDVVCIYNGIFFSIKKNETESFVEMWMDLESVIQSEVIRKRHTNIVVKAMVFPVLMYVCESWTIKKAEHRRIDAFKLWCWRRFLRVTWTARRSNQSTLKEVSPKYSLEGLMLKLQYFGHLM